ncbi:hypothetical protein OOK31_00520 [Streptomyces sp. NBC_00249]|uniref:hypothetical protein n=1 Tax=Streptomyces sp. NBC_00249 TaxID=2975690 RepID=UPI00225776D6|nr:hypothetical protein [Streptomyces sp. NBC_00249]MCX5192384.1 hypothetical protein [Streptomyces sp. NBC_00249]
MSTSEIEEPDTAFLRLFRYAGQDAAAQVAEALGPQGRAEILDQRWYALPEGLRDWVAEHGESREVAALLEHWGLTRRQAALVAARSDLDPALAAAVGTGQAEMAAGRDEAQWLTTPAGKLRNGFGWTGAPSPEMERRVRARLGSDERAWERAFELLAAGFTGTVPDLLDAAVRPDTDELVPAVGVSPEKEVAWLIRLAPGDLPRRLLARFAPWPLHMLASGSAGTELAQPLIDTGDRKAWADLFNATYGMKSRTGGREAEIERAFLFRDDPEINEWLLTSLVSAARDKGYELAPATRLALLEGRPFAPDAADPLPRTPAVHALIASLPSAPWEGDLLRLCFDSREPGLAAQALAASFKGPKTEEALLTPYQQLTAGIRMWEAGWADRLRTLLAARGDGIRDEAVREAFARALAEGSAQPLEAAARALREGDLLDEALGTWGLRLPSGLKPYALGLLSRAELAATSRAITEDPSYRVDWDLVRSRLADPDVRHHRARARERYGVLLAHADCPPDVAVALADPEPGTFDLLRLYADRDTALATLTRGNLGPGFPGTESWHVVGLAVPRPGWAPAVTPEEVLRHARPAQGVLGGAPGEVIGRIVEECFGSAETEAGAGGPTAEAGFWLALRRLTRYSSGPLPQLLRTAVRLAGGGAPLEVVPAADFLVGPERDDAADMIRERLGGTAGPWVHAVRLLTAGFDGTLPELLDAAASELPLEPGRDTLLRCAPAALLGLAPREVIDAAVGELDVAARVALVRTTRSPDTLLALAEHGDRLVWDALLDAPGVRWPVKTPDSRGPRGLREDVVVPALLAQDDPWLNARLVRGTFAGANSQHAALTSAVLAGRPFGPRERPVPVLPGLRADFADWNPDCGAELPKWTANPHFYNSPEPALAMQAMMFVRQSNYQDPPTTVLDVRQSLLAASTIANAGRFDLLEYVAAHWHIRYPYGQCPELRDLFGRAIRLRSAVEIDEELAAAAE